MSQRHQLIYLKNNAQFELTSMHPDPDAMRSEIVQWLALNCPCIYTRQQDRRKNYVNLGLTVLMHHQRHRVGLVVEKSAIECVSNLPRLNEFGLFFPTIKKINQERGLVASVGVYGSFLFDYLLIKSASNTRYSFVTPNSDLDILMDYKKISLHKLSQDISALSHATQRRIDGEVRFDGVGDIAIRELMKTSSHQVLVKRSANFSLMHRAELYEYYPNLLD